MLHVYMHINKTNVYKNMYIYTCIYIYVCIYMCVYILICIYIYACVCVIYNHTYTYACLIGADQCKSPMGSATYTS